MQRLLVALSSFVLTSCWIGEGLYADGDARPALEPGIYRVISPHDAPQEARVTVLPTGMTEVARKDGSAVYGFVPLDGRRNFAVWFDDRNKTDAKERLQFYFLGRKWADGAFILYMPSCDGAEAEIARDAGAEVEKATVPVCRFTSRAGLEAALRRVQPAKPSAMMTFVRLRDR